MLVLLIFSDGRLRKEDCIFRYSNGKGVCLRQEARRVKGPAGPHLSLLDYKASLVQSLCLDAFSPASALE